MGPMRSLSGMISDIQGMTGDVEGATGRMRTASRKLTGGTGEAPTPLTAGAPPLPTSLGTSQPPLMVQLTIGIENLNNSIAALRAEVSHLEKLSETASDDSVVKAANYAAQNNLAQPGYAMNSATQGR